jgi:SAM-dependent methyltransferase
VHAVAGSSDPRLISSVAYDNIARDYDEQVRGDAWMRHALHEHYLRVFRAGHRVLDVGCGTGIDAIALAQAGVHVTGIDGSGAMVEQLRSKARRAGVQHLIHARVLNIQSLDRVDEPPFDGLIAAFASLNTLPDLSAFAEHAAALVRPGGRLVLHLLNRFSLWEWLGCVARHDWRAAGQVGRLRMRAFTIGGQAVPHALYFANQAYRRYFDGRFALRQRYSLGALRPPHTVRRVPNGLVTALERLDLRTGAWPLVRDAGRFFVLDLERLPV